MDGELVCLDDAGHPQFKNLLFRHGESFYLAFDILFNRGRDMRLARLVKQTLKSLIRHSSSPRLLYADHVDGKGAERYHAKE